MRHERAEVGGIAGEQLIARQRHHDDQRIDSVAGAAGCEQLTSRSGLAQPGATHVDHGQQPGKASTSPPRLSHHRGRSAQRCARPPAELDQPSHPPVTPVQGDERPRVEDEVQAADSSVRPGAR
jgi:hypothetical protein